MSHRSLIVLPEDTIQPIIMAILQAEKNIRVKMFLFSEPTLIDALISARKRGVQVRVMLNPSRTNGDEQNQETMEKLLNADIEVRETNPSFRVTHEKSMVVDDSMAFINSLNWERKYLTETRDYAIITHRKHEVQEVMTCFEADWNRGSFNPGDTSHLIWCRGNGRARIARFIDDAKHTLIVQNDRYQDMVIIERLVRAARRGVKVHIMARPPHSLKKEKLVEGVGGLRLMNDVGIKIHNIKHLVLHAKLLFADNEKAIIGSINLSPGSFDERRELAIEVDDDHILQRLHHVLHHDWKHSYPLDLTDEGLLDDLENRGEGGSELLVLNRDKKDKKEG